MNDRERLVEKDEFAKLFDIGGAQLLVMYGASEEPEIELHTQVNGIRVRTALGFGSWSLADEMFNGFEDAQAAGTLLDLRAMVGK